jgi:hypothetical protein
MKIQAFWDVKLVARRVFRDLSKDGTVFKFSIKRQVLTSTLPATLPHTRRPDFSNGQLIPIETSLKTRLTVAHIMWQYLIVAGSSLQ